VTIPAAARRGAVPGANTGFTLSGQAAIDARARDPAHYILNPDGTATYYPNGIASGMPSASYGNGYSGVAFSFKGPSMFGKNAGLNGGAAAGSSLAEQWMKNAAANLEKNKGKKNYNPWLDPNTYQVDGQKMLEAGLIGAIGGTSGALTSSLKPATSALESAVKDKVLPYFNEVLAGPVLDQAKNALTGKGVSLDKFIADSMLNGLANANGKEADGANNPLALNKGAPGPSNSNSSSNGGEDEDRSGESIPRAPDFWGYRGGTPV
jgi:hypothetical protein